MAFLPSALGSFIEALTRRAAPRSAPPDAAADTVDLLLGREACTDRQVTLSAATLGRHMLVSGVVGSGAQAVTLSLVAQHVAKGLPVLYVDGRKDAAMLKTLAAAAERAGRSSDFLSLDFLSDPLTAQQEISQLRADARVCALSLPLISLEPGLAEQSVERLPLLMAALQQLAQPNGRMPRLLVVLDGGDVLLDALCSFGNLPAQLRAANIALLLRAQDSLFLATNPAAQVLLAHVGTRLFFRQAGLQAIGADHSMLRDPGFSLERLRCLEVGWCVCQTDGEPPVLVKCATPRWKWVV